MNRIPLSKLFALFFTIFLIACGGGGNSEAATPPTSNIQEYQLSLTIDGSGLGRIYIEELNQYCPANCTLSIPANSTLSLIAEPANADYQFLYWSDNCTSRDDKKCVLQLNNNTNIAAFFDNNGTTYELNTKVIGDGKIIIDAINEECTAECSYQVAGGQTYYLRAQELPGAQFIGWGNDCGNADYCPMTVRTNTTIQAEFTSVVQSSDITVNVFGAGAVKINDQTEHCFNSCIYQFEAGTNITLSAIEGNEDTFVNWTGACQGDEKSCNLTVSENTTINAFFEQPVASSNNTFTIKEPLGKTSNNVPIQIARPFVEGEIPNYPVVKIAGKNIVSQSTIKQRHDDGSVKHAIINFVLDQLPANGEFLASIENGTPPQGDALTKTEMLSSNFHFDAVQEYSFEGGHLATASARTMLENDHFTKWIEGPVATTLILADHSIERAYDLGNDSHRSIRPIFHVTFWKTLNQYTVRYISENTNTMTLQDQTYDLQLFIGQDKQKIYEKSGVPHQARSMWTKKFSTFDTTTLNLNHNIRYLVQTNSVPYFDVSREISEATIQSSWVKWQSKTKDIYDKGLWQSAMAVAGGRPDIGLYPSWAVQWIFSGDWRLTEIALTQSDLASAWPMHLREGKTGLKFDFEESIDALGKVISLAPGARPTHWTERPDWHEINEPDKIIPLEDLARTSWRPDNAHHPDIATLPYLLTGDNYYLQQMIFSAAYVSGNNNAKAFGHRYGRGETGSEGLLYSGEVRGQAWAFRTRIHAYDIIPDSWPEKAYFNTLNENAIAGFQGLFDLDNSYPSKSGIYNHAKNVVSPRAFSDSKTPSPLGFWDEGATSASYVSSDVVDTNTVKRAIAPWMQNFVTISLGRAKELGYPTDNLLEYSSRYLNRLLRSPTLPNHMFSAYITPSLDTNNQWFNTVEEITNTYTSSYIELINQRLTSGTDTEHGYYSIGMAAASYSYRPEAPLSWQYIRQNVVEKPVYDNNPKWAILPRPNTN